MTFHLTLYGMWMLWISSPSVMIQAITELVLCVSSCANVRAAVINLSKGLSQAFIAGVAVLNRFQSYLKFKLYSKIS
jgi:hypothetical protein